MSNMTVLNTPKTDSELGKEYKDRMGDKLKELCDLMNEAQAHGFFISFQVGKDYIQRYNVADLVVARRY